MVIDAAKKASSEKKIVISLLVLFGLTLSGALKGVIGTHGGTRPTAPVAAPPLSAQPAAQSLRIRPAVMAEAIKHTEEMVVAQTRVLAAPSERMKDSGVETPNHNR